MFAQSNFKGVVMFSAVLHELYQAAYSKSYFFCPCMCSMFPMGYIRVEYNENVKLNKTKRGFSAFWLYFGKRYFNVILPVPRLRSQEICQSWVQ